MLSLPKKVPVHLLLYKTTTCLMQPRTTFFVPQMKKNLSKRTTKKIYLVQKWETNALKDKRFSDYIYSVSTL